MSLDFCCDVQMVGSELGVKNMKAWIILSCLNGSGWWLLCNGVRDIFLAHFGSLSTNWTLFKHHSLPEYCCWPCPSLYDYSVPSSDGYFQQDNAPCHKAQIISDWILEHDDEFTLLKWPPQSPDLNPIEHLWDVEEREIRIMDVQPTNLQQLCDAIMSKQTKISEECFQHLVESMPRRIKAVLKAKGVQPGTSKVYLIKWPVILYIYSGAKKYLVSHHLCKFSHLKRWERPVIFIIGIPQLWNPENHIVGFLKNLLANYGGK